MYIKRHCRLARLYRLVQYDSRMKIGIGTLFSFLFLAIIGCHGVHEDVFSEKYPFSLTLQEGIYDLYWNFSTVDETIHFAVKVKTTGWVGFGISPNGQMPGSDVIIAWVDGEKAYFHVSKAYYM